jgi:hypothetical protein
MDGRYVFDPGRGDVQIAGTLAGPYCVIDDLSGAAVLNVNQNGDHLGPIDLSFAAADEFPLAQTSAFYWTNVTHNFVKQVLLPSHLYQIPTRVNRPQTCNAFFSSYDVSINFFRAGSGCQNTAYSDVVIHEYGHAVDHALGGIHRGGDNEVGGSAYSEGFSDVLAILITRQPRLGRDFRGPGTFLRNAGDVVRYPQPPGSGAHHVGKVYSGFVWQLIRELRRCHSEDEAYAIAKQLVLGAAMADPYNIPDAVWLMFLADDDDGNLSNGTPHFKQLARAADSRTIPRPVDPESAPGPRFALEGPCGTHHLAVSTGTAFYHWKTETDHPFCNKTWLTTLKYKSEDDYYWYFCESEFPGYQWAFSKYHDCCCQRSVYFCPDDEVAPPRWMFFHKARRIDPVNATSEGYNLRH